MKNLFDGCTSSLIFDALEKLSLPCGVLSDDIFPLNEDDILHGRIFTLQGVKDVTQEQKEQSRLFFQYIEEGDVILINTGDSRGVGHWGELMSHGARQRKAAGVIVNGGCRDTKAVKELAFPVFCQYFSPYESGAKYCIGSWGEAIVMPGIGEDIKVHPGDYVFGDIDGIIVFASCHLSNVIDKAKEIKEKEERTIVDIKNGLNINESFINNGVL